MKKIILLLCCVLMCSCAKQESIATIVEKENNVAIAINYPETGISDMDNEIQKYIGSVYDGFKEEYAVVENGESELNIDYQYEVIEHYTSVSLLSFINSYSLAHPIQEIKTFVYYNNKKITLADIMTMDTLEQIVPYMKEQLLSKYKDCILEDSLRSEIIADFQNYDTFQITAQGLVLYFNPYIITSGNCGIIHIIIPFDKIGLTMQTTFQEIQYVQSEKTKVIDPNKKIVAITFDDGPSKYTNRILDLLEKYDANATFFVLGNKVKTYQETINRSILLGNEIGNHSYNHKWLTRLDIEEMKEQIDKTQSILQEMNHYTPRLLRPTYGSINKRIRNNTDLEIVLWNVDSLDWKLKNGKKIAQRVLKDVEDMDIILFHDIYTSTYDALEIVLPKLQAEGYQFVTVSELQEVKFLRQRGLND